MLEGIHDSSADNKHHMQNNLKLKYVEIYSNLLSFQ